MALERIPQASAGINWLGPWSSTMNGFIVPKEKLNLVRNLTSAHVGYILKTDWSDFLRDNDTAHNIKGIDIRNKIYQLNTIEQETEDLFIVIRQIIDGPTISNDKDQHYIRYIYYTQNGLNRKRTELFFMKLEFENQIRKLIENVEKYVLNTISSTDQELEHLGRNDEQIIRMLEKGEIIYVGPNRIRTADEYMKHSPIREHENIALAKDFIFQ